MKNAISRVGRTCVSMALATGLIAGGLFASTVGTVKVTLPHAVTVGSTTLPSGDYTISGMNMSDGDEYFVVRSASTPALTLQAQKIVANDRKDRTEVVLTKDGDLWRLDKMFVQGEGNGYQFVNIK